MTPTVILLDGVGSAGKTSIARAFQEVARDPFLHVQMDGFFDMLPAGTSGYHPLSMRLDDRSSPGHHRPGIVGGNE